MRRTPLKSAGSSLNPFRMIGWGIVAALIALPAIAMRFTGEVNWITGDFVFAIVMLGGVGLAFEMAVRASGSFAYRAGVAMALGAGLLLLWGNAAVGIIGNEDRLINLWFNLIPLVALAGAIGARFRAQGMVAAMTATAAAQLGVGIVTLYHGHSVWVFTMIWTGGWLFSSWLFLKASRES